MSEPLSPSISGAPLIELWHLPEGQLVLASVNGKASRECQAQGGQRLGTIDSVAIGPRAALSQNDLLELIMRQELEKQALLQQRIAELKKQHSDIKLI